MREPLEENDIASALIGADALAVHGYPRYSAARYSAAIDLLVLDRRALWRWLADVWSRRHRGLDASAPAACTCDPTSVAT